jgi:Intracellular proteinase inhibitor
MLRLELEVPGEVPVGSPVPIVLRLVNEGAAVDVMLQGRPVAFDILVTRPDGTEVWRRLAGATIPMILQVKPMAPGEIVEWRDRWDQRSSSGGPAGADEYRVVAVLPTDPPGELRSAPRTLRLTPDLPPRSGRSA